MIQGILISHQDDAVHMRALLGRFAMWGMLKYYDMDRVFDKLENLISRYFMVFFDETMNWGSFVKFLEEMCYLDKDPLKHSDHVCLFLPDSERRLYTFEELQSQVRMHGTP